MLLPVLLLCEEEEEEAEGIWGSALDSPPKPLPLSKELQQRYIAIVDDGIVQHSRYARRSRRWFLATSLMAAVTAGAVPVTIAVSAPNWIPAVLGGVAALMQVVEQLLQNGKLSVEHNTIATRYSTARRGLLVSLLEEKEDVAFRQFVDRVEAIKSENGARILGVINSTVESKDPPRS